MPKKYWLIGSMLLVNSAYAHPSVSYQADPGQYTHLETLIKPINTTNVKGYYWANQFHFNVDKKYKAAYIGIQPRPKDKDKLAIFSIFGSGPKSNHPNCRPGADGGAGVSCSAKFAWKNGHVYSLRVKKIPSKSQNYNRWQGQLVDLVTKKRQVIGEYETPKSWGLLTPYTIFFDEWFLFNRKSQQDVSKRACIPYAKVNVYYPVLSNSALKKSISKPISSKLTGGTDRCSLRDKKPNFELKAIPGGHQFISGFLKE